MKLSSVRQRVRQEGFDYAFRHYSDFSKVKDEKFHELRKAYIEAADELADYIGYDEDGFGDEDNEDDE